jgi:hypothetical protein
MGNLVSYTPSSYASSTDISPQFTPAFLNTNNSNNNSSTTIAGNSFNGNNNMVGNGVNYSFDNRIHLPLSALQDQATVDPNMLMQSNYYVDVSQENYGVS